MRRIVFTAVAVGLVTWACSTAAPPDPESEGARLYVANCAECHGVDAAGLKASNLRTGLDAGYVAATMTDGVEGMPTYTDTLTPDQIRTLADYIHEIGTSTGD